MPAGDLTTLANVEGFLKLQAGNADEALLSRLITASSIFAQSWCNRQFASQSFSETRDGTGSNRMVFGNPPVSAVTSVVIDGWSIPIGDAVSAPGYYFTPRRLMLNGYRFSVGLGNVELSYEGGFAAIPDDIEQAVIEIVVHAYKERDRIGHSSQAMAGETTSYIVRDMPPRAESILRNYKRVVPI